jgi:methionine-S-sulfoxide reductase
MSESSREVATLGGGCFWCMEAVFKRVDGVHSVTSGYAGGHAVNPSYEDVCAGSTGHAEVVQIEFDPAVITYEAVLRLFFKAHDPTTPNRQGADIGTQYRSIVLFDGAAQESTAQAVKEELAAVFAAPVVTEVLPLEEFHAAEDYHQDYFDKNPTAGYCRVVIAPKLGKMGMPIAPIG